MRRFALAVLLLAASLSPAQTPDLVVVDTLHPPIAFPVSGSNIYALFLLTSSGASVESELTRTGPQSNRSYNCSVEIRSSSNDWRTAIANLISATSASKQKLAPQSKTEVCRFALPHRELPNAACVRIVFRYSFAADAKSIRSTPFIIDKDSSSIRSCKP